MKNSIDIWLVLSQLTREQRAAVILHYYEGLTYESVASRLGWKRWKVKKRIYDARCIMRKVTGIRLGRLRHLAPLTASGNSGERSEGPAAPVGPPPSTGSPLSKRGPIRPRRSSSNCDDERSS